jgi:mannose-6-phosphate isomerase-like protein (cupin superfamily)
MVGGRTPLAGEHRGGTVIKPAQFILSPGNIVRIPAGVPHSFVVEPGAPLEYLLIKVRRGSLPLN